MDKDSAPLPRWFAPLLLVLAVLAAVSVTAIVMGQSDPQLRQARTPDPGVEDMRIPDFTLTNQQGNTTNADSLDGHYTILDFIFTNCPFVCPGMSSRMAMLQDDLAGTGVRFVSISVDPDHDSPARLTEYAQHIGADTNRWTFLTGDRAQIWSIVRDNLHFDVSVDGSRTIDLPQGQQMSNISHPSKLILIGPDRQVLGLYSWQVDQDIDNLARRIRLLTTTR